MILEVRPLIDYYLNWVRDKTQLRELGNVIEITTPSLDRHNDYIQIYIKKDGKNFIITDDSYTIIDLEQSGCNLDSPRRQHLLKLTFAFFGIQNVDKELFVSATTENFPYKKHNLIQAICAVNDLFFLGRPHVESLFLEDVTLWLDENDIRYTPKVKFTGKSGYDHLFDFVVPKSKQAPERILSVINNPGKGSAQNAAFSWIDTKDVRSETSRAYAILNDNDKMVASEVSEALRNYDVIPVLWSEREIVREMLAA